jgi:hypothetical protein
MRGIILLMVIAILANIGMAVQIKIVGQPITKNMLSEVKVEALVGNQITQPATPSVPALKLNAGDIADKLGSLRT